MTVKLKGGEDSQDQKKKKRLLTFFISFTFLRSLVSISSRAGERHLIFLVAVREVSRKTTAGNVSAKKKPEGEA